MNALRIHTDDNVVIAVSRLAQGTRLELPGGDPGAGLITREAIPFGHKVAVIAIPEGAPVVKYGSSIGLATADIAPGEHVHVHNLRSVRGAASS